MSHAKIDYHDADNLTKPFVAHTAIVNPKPQLHRFGPFFDLFTFWAIATVSFQSRQGFLDVPDGDRVRAVHLSTYPIHSSHNPLSRSAVSSSKADKKQLCLNNLENFRPVNDLEHWNGAYEYSAAYRLATLLHQTESATDARTVPVAVVGAILLSWRFRPGRVVRANAKTEI